MDSELKSSLSFKNISHLSFCVPLSACLGFTWIMYCAQYLRHMMSTNGVIAEKDRREVSLLLEDIELRQSVVHLPDYRFELVYDNCLFHSQIMKYFYLYSGEKNIVQLQYYVVNRNNFFCSIVRMLRVTSNILVK